MNRMAINLFLSLVLIALSQYARAEIVLVDDVTGVASYISGSSHRARTSGEAAARFYLGKHRKELGIDSVKEDLRLIRAVRAGQTVRFNFQQISGGRRVLDSVVGVALRQDEQTLVSISSAYNPLAKSVKPAVKIKAREAVGVVRSILPSAVEIRARELVMIQPVPTEPGLKFVWLVDAEDPQVDTFMTYAVDATDGFVEDSIALIHSAMDRLTRDAQSNSTRKEGESATGNADIDSAHDATGAAYTYFNTELGFDSFDGAGGTIQALVNDPDSNNNAYYKDKTKGLYFGPGMAALDVAVHEFAHGVVAHTSGLVYKGQSGALNESYADVFGVIVDSDDWLLGEDLPNSFLRGKPALRDVKDPAALSQPGQVKDYQASCGVDNDGVHINSGIPNRGFYEVATRLGRSDAGKIYFQALTALSPKADFSAHRQATLDATKSLFPDDEKKYQAVQEGLAAAGLVEGMSVSVCPTSSCPIAGSARRLSGQERRDFGRNMAAAYRLRDEVLKRHQIIGDYALEKYGSLSGDLARSVFTNPSIALDVLSYVRMLTPVINRVGDGELNQHTVSPDLVRATEEMIEKVQQAFMKAGKEGSAEKLAQVVKQFDLGRLAGKSYSDAMGQLRDMVKKAREGEQKGQGQGKKSETDGKGQADEKEPQDGGQAESPQEKSSGDGESEEPADPGQGRSQREQPAPEQPGKGQKPTQNPAEQRQGPAPQPGGGDRNQLPPEERDPEETPKSDAQVPTTNRPRPDQPQPGGNSPEGREAPKTQTNPPPNCC